MDSDAFVGCASGLRDNKWYYLSDLWIQSGYRHKGLGKKLLSLWETRIASEGVRNIYTWTAGFQAPQFYVKQGYTIFVEFDYYYQNGYSRVGLRKVLVEPANLLTKQVATSDPASS